MGKMIELVKDVGIAIAIGIIFLLAGCAHTETKYITVEPPPPPIIARPDLPVLSLKDGDDAGFVLQAHRETIKILQAWGKELETALNAYRKDK